jgi:hypothetical protein
MCKPRMILCLTSLWTQFIQTSSRDGPSVSRR